MSNFCVTTALFNPEVAKLEDCLEGLDQDRAAVKEEIARLKEHLQAVTASKEKYLQETLDVLRREKVCKESELAQYREAAEATGTFEGNLPPEAQHQVPAGVQLWLDHFWTQNEKSQLELHAQIRHLECAIRQKTALLPLGRPRD